MTATERREKIIRILNVRRKVSKAELCKMLGVYMSTMDIDIDVLSRSYPIVIKLGRTGGVTLKEHYHLKSGQLTERQVEVLSRLSMTAKKDDRDVIKSILLDFGKK